MYNSDSWDICPWWFIPAGFLWVVLDTLWEKLDLLDKLCNKFPRHSKYRINKWIHRVTGIFSYTVTFLVGVLVHIWID